jgi:hypothetical protein
MQNASIYQSMFEVTGGETNQAVKIRAVLGRRKPNIIIDLTRSSETMPHPIIIQSDEENEEGMVVNMNPDHYVLPPNTIGIVKPHDVFEVTYDLPATNRVSSIRRYQMKPRSLESSGTNRFQVRAGPDETLVFIRSATGLHVYKLGSGVNLDNMFVPPHSSQKVFEPAQTPDRGGSLYRKYYTQLCSGDRKNWINADGSSDDSRNGYYRYLDGNQGHKVFIEPNYTTSGDQNWLRISAMGFNWQGYAQEYQVYQQLKAEGRYLKCPDILDYLNNGDDTLVIEVRSIRSGSDSVLEIEYTSSKGFLVGREKKERRIRGNLTQNQLYKLIGRLNEFSLVG